MATYALIHGAYDVGWYWHLVERELRARGHTTVAPDLPIEDEHPERTEEGVHRAEHHDRAQDLPCRNGFADVRCRQPSAQRTVTHLVPAIPLLYENQTCAGLQLYQWMRGADIRD